LPPSARRVTIASCGAVLPEPVLDRETLNGIIRKLMSIDTKVARLVEELLETDGEEEADT
jgi:hypothetical protein